MNAPVATPLLHELVASGGWSAALEIEFDRRQHRTIPARRRHRGPLRLQRAFHPEGAPCHVYLLHPPGGVVGGDSLDIRIGASAGAHGVVTTPAATKFYRSAGPVALQSQALRVADGATLEWLPQEQIAFDGAIVRSTTRVELQGAARFIGWELTCLGRPASGSPFRHGEWRGAFELWRDGSPLLVERTRLRGGCEALGARWGLGGATAFATLTAIGADADLVATARAVLEDAPGVHGVTLIEDDLLVVRWLGDGTERGRHILQQVWTAIRPALLERPASPPRIWRT